MSEKSKLVVNGSLKQLGELVNKAGIQLKSPVKVPPKDVRKTAVCRLAFCATTDEELFIAAMQGVKRTSWRHNLLPSTEPSPLPPENPEVEARRLMQATVDGEMSLTVLDHPEYIEGWIGVAGKRFLPNLRNGLYSIQGQIDLHGLSRLEARKATEDFIIQMSRFRCCCVKIIHGRGINSPSDKAILKENLQRWLSTRRMSRHVVAYASAPFNDGGVGAVYVLLRH